MTYTHEMSDGAGRFTEVVEDETLAAALAAGEPCTFRVIEDEWNDDYTVRIIRRVEMERSYVSTEPAEPE